MLKRHVQVSLDLTDTAHAYLAFIFHVVDVGRYVGTFSFKNTIIDTINVISITNIININII